MYPAEKEALFELGDQPYHKADYVTAISYFEKLLAVDPSFERAINHIIVSHRVLRQYDQMLEHATAYVAQKPCENAYTILGQAYLLLKDFDKAEQTWYRAYDLFPNNPMSLVNLAWTYFFQNENNKAEAEFIKLIQESQPLFTQIRGLRHLGFFYGYFGKYRNVLGSLDQVIELALENGDTSVVPLSYAEKAFWIIWGWGDKVKALEMIEEGFNHEEDANIYFYQYLLKIYLKMGEYEMARSIVEDYLKEFMPYLGLLVDAHIYRARGEYRNAINSLSMVCNSAMLFDQIYYSYELAECYFQIGQFEEAIQALHRIQNVYNNSHYFRSAVYPRSFYLLGKIYEAKMDRNLAIENYEKFLNFWKDADYDLTDLVDTKTQLARLKGVETK